MMESLEKTTMSFIGRHAGLAIAVLLTVFLAIARYHGGSPLIPTPPPTPVAAPAQPAVPVVKAKKKVRRKLAAKLTVQPAAPAKVRGARLREVGEALGGRTPERVDKATETLSAQ